MMDHYRGEAGSVGLLMLKSLNGNRGDYHKSMNHETFRAWFENQLLPYILPHSLVIMDNDSYHCKVINKATTQSSRKHEIIKWLADHNLPHDPLHSKAELLHQVKKITIKKCTKQTKWQTTTVTKCCGFRPITSS